MNEYPRPWRVARAVSFGPTISDIRDAGDGLVEFSMPTALAEFIVARVNAGEKESTE